MIAAAVMTLVVTLALCGPVIAVAVGAADPVLSQTTAFRPPGGGHLLGTDDLGRDVAARLLVGGVDVLVVPVVAVAVSTLLGVGIGLALAAGPHRGRRAVAALDVLLVLPPVLVLVVAIYAFGPGAATLVGVAALLNAPFTARLVRAVADPVLDAGYVSVAVAGGAGVPAVLIREILPAVRGTVLADAGNRLVGAIYLVATAGFLGARLDPRDVSWAGMVADGLPGIRSNPAAVLAPALAIGALAVSVNLVVDRWARR